MFCFGIQFVIRYWYNLMYGKKISNENSNKYNEETADVLLEFNLSSDIDTILYFICAQL